MGDKEKKEINQNSEKQEEVIKVDESPAKLPEMKSEEQIETEKDQAEVREEQAEPKEAEVPEEQVKPEETEAEEIADDLPDDYEESDEEIEGEFSDDYEESDEEIVILGEDDFEDADFEDGEGEPDTDTEEVKSEDEPEPLKEEKRPERKKKKKKKKPSPPVEENEEPESPKGEKGKRPKRRKKKSEPPVEEEQRSELEKAEDAWEKSKKRKKTRKRLLIVLVLIVAAYAGVAVFFHSHFLPYTKINGKYFPMKNVQQVEEYMGKQVDDYVLTLVEQKGRKEQIVGKDIDLKYIPDQDVQKVLDEQNEWLWVKALWDHPDIEAPIGVEYNERKLANVIKKLRCITQEQVAPISAHPEFNGERFEVVEETLGTQINRERFDKAIEKAISGFTSEIDLTKEKCYVLPKFLKDAKEVSEAAEKMNGYLGANITLDFSPKTEVIGSEQIAQWLKVDDDMQVIFDQELVRAFVAELANKYDTYGKPRTFVTGYGDTVQVEGGTYGWQIDQEAEFHALVENIQKAETVTREPNYARRGATHEGYDFGNTYAEVDLTKQHFFFFQNGQCLMQCDVVTGNPRQDNGTPQGVYSLAYKSRNQTLRGPKRPDGSYEWESPVAYWMPFNGGIGFHDAPWRSSFGGSIYDGNGSHGCVNMPPASAAELYSLISAGMPVVCHY